MCQLVHVTVLLELINMVYTCMTDFNFFLKRKFLLHICTLYMPTQSYTTYSGTRYSTHAHCKHVMYMYNYVRVHVHVHCTASTRLCSRTLLLSLTAVVVRVIVV